MTKKRRSSATPSGGQEDLVARFEAETPDWRDVQAADAGHAAMLLDDDVADLQDGAGPEPGHLEHEVGRDPFDAGSPAMV